MSHIVLKSLALLGLTAAGQLALAEVPEQFVETPLALAFGAPPSIGDPMLSPDGSRLLFTQQNPQGVSMLQSLDLADGAITTVLQGELGGFDISWCHFASGTRVFCLLRQGMPDTGPQNQRLVAVNVDGTELQSMPELLVCLRYDHLRNQPPIDWLPDDAERVLVHCGGYPGNAPELLDIYTRRQVPVSGPDDIGDPVIRNTIRGTDFEFIAFHESGAGNLGRGQSFYADGHGKFNIYRGRQDNLDHWFYRDSDDSRWREFLTVDPLAFDAPFRPVGYGTSLDRAFNIDWDPATETWGLFRRNLTGDGDDNSLVFSHETVNVELVDTMGRQQRVVAAAFLDGRAQRAIVDRRIGEVYQYLYEQLPEFEIEIVDESWDQNRYLARGRARNSAGELLLVDMEDRTIEPLGPEYQHLAGYRLAETRLLEIDSSTSGRFAAHLTLPPEVNGSEPAAPLPAVIIPRARPSHEDVADPHYLTQFLAASGYAVLRVSNRVDEEFGRGWVEERAVIGWQQSVTDIRDAANYLIDDGIAAADRLCAAGKDYGAYTALMTAIEHPELIRCVITIGAVTDPRETPGGVIVNGRGSGSRAVLNAASPLRRHEELNAPALMFHGRYDYEFRTIEHTAQFANSLERAEKNVLFIDYPFEISHDIKRGPDRVDMLARSSRFLDEHIGSRLTD